MGIIFLRKRHNDVVNKGVMDYLNGDLQKYSSNIGNIRAYAFTGTDLRELDAPECTSVGYSAVDQCINIERISCPKATTFNLLNMPDSLKYLDVRSMVDGTLGIPKYSGGGSLSGNLEELYANSLKVAKNIGFLDLPNLKILNLESLEQYGEVPSTLVSTSYPTIKSDFRGVEVIDLPELIIGYDILCGPNTKELSIPKMQIGRVCLEGNTHIKKLVCTDVAWVDATSNGVTSQEPREKIMNLRNSALEELDVASTYLLCNNCSKLVMAKNRIHADKGNYFGGCSSLERVELPEQRTSTLSCFTNCGMLKYVDMPKAVNFPSHYSYIGTSARDIVYVTTAKSFFGSAESLEFFNAP